MDATAIGTICGLVGIAIKTVVDLIWKRYKLSADGNEQLREDLMSIIKTEREYYDNKLRESDDIVTKLRKENHELKMEILHVKQEVLNLRAVLVSMSKYKDVGDENESEIR